jgi:hypothetical protein
MRPPETDANEELPPIHSDRQEKGIGGDEPEADNERLTVKSPIPEATAPDQAPVHPRPNGLEKVTATLEDKGVRRRLRLDYHRLVGSPLTLTGMCSPAADGYCSSAESAPTLAGDAAV